MSSPCAKTAIVLPLGAARVPLWASVSQPKANPLTTTMLFEAS